MSVANSVWVVNHKRDTDSKVHSALRHTVIHWDTIQNKIKSSHLIIAQCDLVLTCLTP